MTLKEAISVRHSVRRYTDKPISQDVISILQAKVEECNNPGSLHIQLVTNEPNLRLEPVRKSLSGYKINALMKHFSIFMVMMALLSMTSCNRNGSKRNIDYNQEGGGVITQEEYDPFEAFAEHFSETASFAYAEISGRKVLLVSQETFGNNVNEDKEAIEASIFALDGKDKIVTLGSIRSQGTLYPVSLLDGKFMVAGHQFVKIYSIRGEDVPELVLDSYGEGEVHEIEELYKTFEKGTSVKFRKKLFK